MKARLLRGVGANLYGQAVTAVAQLGTVPILLKLWNAELFGTWLTIAAWTSVLSLADAGLMAATGSAMTVAVAGGRQNVAAGLFVRLLRLVLAIAAVLAGLVTAASVALPGPWDASTRCTAVALALAALSGLPIGTIELGFRAQGDYAVGLCATSSVRLAEAVAVVLAALGGSTPVGAACALLATRIIGLVLTGWLLRRRAPWLRAYGRPDGGADLRPLIRPALAALAIPAALALSLQGTTIAAGLVVPSGAVALFVAARTLARALVQMLGLLTHALMPEMAIATGRGDALRAAQIVRLNLLGGLLLLGPGWAVLMLAGPSLMEWWTAGKLRPDPTVFGLMATAALAHGCWLSATNLLLAVNRQAEYAYLALAVAAGTCLLVGILGWLWALPGVASACLAGEIAVALLVVPSQVAQAFPRRSGFQAVDVL